MGVPAFFRWLSRKYPSVIVECVENKQTDDCGRPIFEDATLPNPNGVEFDNLYLDMNGIIHPCTHPEDKPPPKNEDEMMEAIFECIDRLFGIVRPRKLVYMAIDGVAPRAKMNQQRSRRFRASKESREKQLEMQRIRSELLAKGCVLPPEKEKGEHFDSNCITPGTPFMDRLSQCLHYYIHVRLNTNPAWKGVKVILSDANVPGEGEHKIMDFIRKQRAQPDHDPNTQHVLCGADADLIMLGLATHEPNFTIIREEFLPNKPKPCDICEQFGHEMDKCTGLNATNSSFKPDVPIGQEVKFIFVRLSVLREYLKTTLEMPNLPFKYDFDRALDDWVFMCFFVGNDFLPHLPSLEIREGAIDRLVDLYKKSVYKTKSYLTDSGEVNLKGVQSILSDLGMVEDQIFKDRQRKEKEFKAREKHKRMRDNQYNAASLEKSDLFKPVALGQQGGRGGGGGGRQGNNSNMNYKQEAMRIRMEGSNNSNRGVKRTASQAGLNDDDEEEEANDEVRLWEDGFKDRYYESKFDVTSENKGFRYSVALQYVRGLCWVLKYYYQGCASWNWYFPYHYAPFASDFVNIDGLSTAFEKNTKPFSPLEQLMGVFPAASSSHVPPPWAVLMSDPNSPIIDFYPEDFKIDLNGKKFAWQGVALLPFVDERRLFKALKKYYGKLTEEEKRRNKMGDSLLYVTRANPNFNTVKKTTECKSDMEGFPVTLEGIRGLLLKSPKSVPIGGTLASPVAGLKPVYRNEVLTVRFRDPTYTDGFIFPAKRLANAVDPPKVLPAHGNKNNDRRPVIGFNRNMQTANIAPGGHRMIAAQMNRNNSNQGQHSGFRNNWGNNQYNNEGKYSQQGYNYNQGKFNNSQQFSGGFNNGNNYQRNNNNSNNRNQNGNNRYQPYNNRQQNNNYHNNRRHF